VVCACAYLATSCLWDSVFDHTVDCHIMLFVVPLADASLLVGMYALVVMRPD